MSSKLFTVKWYSNWSIARKWLQINIIIHEFCHYLWTILTWCYLNRVYIGYSVLEDRSHVNWNQRSEGANLMIAIAPVTTPILIMIFLFHYPLVCICFTVFSVLFLRPAFDISDVDVDLVIQSLENDFTSCLRNLIFYSLFFTILLIITYVL